MNSRFEHHAMREVFGLLLNYFVKNTINVSLLLGGRPHNITERGVNATTFVTDLKGFRV